MFLELVTPLDNEWLYCAHQNIRLLIFIYPFNLWCFWNLVHTWTMSSCIVRTRISDCWYSFILLFFWCFWNLVHTWTVSSCIVHTRISDCWYSFILLFFDVSGTWYTLGQWVAVLCTPEYQTADIHLSFYSFDVPGTWNTLGQWVAVLCAPEYQTADIRLSFYSLMFLELGIHLDNE